MEVACDGSKSIYSRTPLVEVLLVLQENGHSNSTFRNANDVQRSRLIAQLLDNVVEDVVNVFFGIPVSGDRVLFLIKPIRDVHGTFLRKCIPAYLCDGFLSPAPPSQLAHVGEDDTWGLSLLRLEPLDVLN